ncbi:hypothetical protein LVJ94_46645 [Pendulispora rubella]|uniref:RNA polymerase sigma-70 ECF-like HTH domain-containing protein n=1 Tax=Pendulispora rubella TaxID=2741070 RepID=A0ABZ2L0N0_9BACT
MYWKPVYKYLRLRWRFSPEETQDITQDFFLKVVERDLFATYDPNKGRFRTFVRVCLDRFVVDRGRIANALKRGGNTPPLSVDFARAEEELTFATEVNDPFDVFFDGEWMRHLLGLAVEKLETECSSKGKNLHYRIFERFYLHPAGAPSYAELATEFAVSITEITNRLGFARREFRRVLLDSLRAITATDEEFRAEARALLGDTA